MAEWHLSADLFRRFLEGAAPKEDAKQLVRHLLQGCEACQDLAARLMAESGQWLPPGDLDFTEEGYERAFTDAFDFATEEERRVALERLLGSGQWAAVEQFLPEERRILVLADRDYHHWGFYRALLDAARS